jgi:hypothetical protein
MSDEPFSGVRDEHLAKLKSSYDELYIETLEQLERIKARREAMRDEIIRRVQATDELERLYGAGEKNA